MKKITKLVTSILVALFLITSLTTNFVSAATPSTGEIDYILIKMENNNIVRITIDEYIDLFLSQTEPLYSFLTGTQDDLTVYGVVSGEKYINIDEYVNQFLIEGSSTDALESSDELTVTEVNSFLKIKLGSIESGNIQLEPIVETIEVFQVIDIY